MTRAGRYELGEVVGVGSFATVHRATDARLDDTVVVKILAENHSLNTQIRERFIAEGRSLRRVNSAYVVRVHDIGENERHQPYLVLQYADRGTLAQRVRAAREQGWRAGAGDVLVVAEQLATALEAVHTARLVHRDLSPENVLITTAAAPPEGGQPPGGSGQRQGRLLGADEHLLLADLGMCKDLALNSGLTVAGGTAGFRAPELSAGPAVVDARTDLWSLSALLTWFCEDADLPPALKEALERGQAEDPDDRFPDVASWLAAIRKAVEPPPWRPAAPEAAETGSSPTPPARRRFAATVVAALVAVVLGVTAGWVLRGLGGPSSSTDSASLQIVGPDEASVGERVTFSVEHSGVDSVVWTLPTGGHIVGHDAVTLTADSAGTAKVSVAARDEQGRDLAVEHEFAITAD